MAGRYSSTGVGFMFLVGVASIAAQETAGDATPATRPAPTTFDDLATSRPTARLATLPPWSWPSREAFAARSNPDTLRPHETYVARLDVVYGAESIPYDAVIQKVVGENGRTRLAVVAFRPADEGRVSLLHDRVDELVCDPAPRDGDPPTPLAFAYYAYGAIEPTLKATGTSVRALSRPRPSKPLADLWGYVATLLDDSPGDPELPAGQCSMDRGPARAAGTFAQKAAREGALGRCLRLRLRVISDSFDRIIWSSYGSAAADTGSPAADAPPIRVDALFAGLCLGFDCDVPRALEIHAYRLGRAIAEAGLTARLGPWLRSIVEDENVDAYNRLRAMRTLYDVHAHNPAHKPLSMHTSRTRTRDDVIKDLGSLRIPEAGRIWLQMR